MSGRFLTIARVTRWFAAVGLISVVNGGTWAAPSSVGPTFEVVFPNSTHQEFLTGRLLVMISRKSEPEVRLQVGWIDGPPVFGVDVSRVEPGQMTFIDGGTPGYPLQSLKDLPAGDYYVQALLNVYSEFHRADGHVIWAHMDQWEGQQFNTSPGNLYSPQQPLHWDPSRPKTVRLALTQIIPPIPVPADTPWIKHVKIQSRLLSKFWGRPIYLGAVVLLPRDYDSDPRARYPVIYQQTHFSQDAPFGFVTEPSAETDSDRVWASLGVETGYKFQLAWRSEHFPKAIAVTFQHPTPYYDDSYAVNSANNGPYGDAIMTELIPYIEEHFRTRRQSHSRVLVGGSTGGWESLALQLYHPDFFGGAWILYPDPIDFRNYGQLDVYRENNAFVAGAAGLPEWLHRDWMSLERPIWRAADGLSLGTVRQLTELEEVLGTKGRSGGQVAIWDAVFGPVDNQGYPRPLWNRNTGEIDAVVAQYMREHGYDLREYAQTHWQTIGPQLKGKLHFYCGEMDSFYLNLAVYRFQQFMAQTTNPHIDASFQYGRPMKGHGWQPMSNAALVKAMLNEMATNGQPIDTQARATGAAAAELK